MKKQLSLLAGISVLALQSLFGQNTIPEPEVLHYKFDESGTLVTNYATGGIAPATATIMGSITQSGASSSCDGALVGSGNSSTTDYLNTGWSPNLGAGAWSIVFTTTGIAGGSTLYYIFGDAGTTSFRCFTNGVAGPNNWILRGAGLTDTYINGGALPTQTTCAFVYDPTLNNVKGYLNGVLVTTVAQVAPNMTGTGPLKVMGYSANVGAPAGGLMEDYRFYNRALTAAEVLQLYTLETYDTLDVVACSTPYTSPSGNHSWSTPGQYYDTIPNSYCGDSLMTINLTFSQPASDTIDVSACDTYDSPSGLYTWTASGTYNDTLSTVLGCDSLLVINLTVNYSVNDTIDVFACDSYTSPSGLYNWTASGVYNDTIPTAAGCDSLLVINLTVNYATTDTIDVAECDSYDSPSGNYTWNTSGTYNDTIPNAAGCDSLLVINLTLSYSTNASQTVSACDSYMAEDGNTYTQSGNYDIIITNAAGCDSIISLDLTIDTIDTNVTVNGLTLTSATSGADSYQWIDCATQQPIAGATAASFTATQNGSYAVMITNGSCSATSECVTISNISVAELSENLVSIFPNPVNDVLTVSNPEGRSLVLELFDVNGHLVSTLTSEAASIPVEMKSFARGIYTLNVRHENSIQTLKVVRN